MNRAAYPTIPASSVFDIGVARPVRLWPKPGRDAPYRGTPPPIPIMYPTALPPRVFARPHVSPAGLNDNRAAIDPMPVILVGWGMTGTCAGRRRPKGGRGLVAAGLAVGLTLMAFGALATLGGALLLRLLFGIRIMTAVSQAAAATFLILLMPAGVCRLIARIRGWDPDPDPTERN